MNNDSLMNRDEDGDSIFESFEIEQDPLSRSSTDGSFVRPQNRGNSLYALPLILLAVLLANHHRPQSEIISCTTSSGGLCDVKTATANSDPFTFPANMTSEIAAAKPTASPTTEPNNLEIPAEDRGNQNTKYLLYFAESGWANQEICLEHAFYMARALNRTLILPPVLPHLGKGSTTPRDVFGMDSGNFKTWVDPLKFFIKKLPSQKYIPITTILDHDYSFAGVQTIDAKAFASMEESKIMTRWVVEYNFTHFNTKWTFSSNLEGTLPTQTRNEYGETRILNMTHRDIATEFKGSTEDILVLLDGFKSVFDESAMDPPFQPRMSDPIRQAANAVRDRWKVPAYAAVHIRGGDGRFKKEEKLKESITTAMDHISLQLTEWSGNHSHEVDTVGLYVATDVNDLFDHPRMIHEVEELLDSIRNSGNVTVEFLSGKGISNETESLGDLRYAGVFMDIQMAACATIGYIGTEGSTFSQLIQDHRHANSC
jgi:hypothetical protein